MSNDCKPLEFEDPRRYRGEPGRDTTATRTASSTYAHNLEWCLRGRCLRSVAAAGNERRGELREERWKMKALFLDVRMRSAGGTIIQIGEVREKRREEGRTERRAMEGVSDR